ncbi:Imm42 family immunity protein [Faucicola mancuniensis]|uniref:Imm42 family immunity protein n=1 Tax=Faucicola mancuniensis TaxID=1309795 RepID=UPI0039775742
MIFGNPDYFAIYADKITNWSYDNFDEGAFAYILKNELFPKNIFFKSSTLGVYHGDLILLKENIQKGLLDSFSIFHMNNEQLYNFLYSLSFKSNDNQELKFLILIGEMIDDSEPIFAVSYDDKIKIIYLINEITNSIDLKKDDFLEILNSCIEWMSTNIK